MSLLFSLPDNNQTAAILIVGAAYLLMQSVIWASNRTWLIILVTLFASVVYVGWKWYL